VKTTLENFNGRGMYTNTHLHTCMEGHTPPPPPPPAAAAAAAQESVRPVETAATEAAVAAAGCSVQTPAAAAATATAVSGPDAPGCVGMARLTESWKRQAAYVDWALQVCVRE
jgi:hypothetical protein